MSLDLIYRDAADSACKVAAHVSQMPVHVRQAGLPSGGVALDAMNTSPIAMMGDAAGNTEMQYQHFRGWVYASVRPICQAIAGQPIRVARERAGRAPINEPGDRAASYWRTRHAPRHIKAVADKLEVYDSHIIYDLLEDPNPAMTGWAVMYATVASLELTGEAYWWITVEHGVPRLWPIPKSWIAPIHDKDKGIFQGWVITPRGTGRPIERPANEVVFFSYPDPGDPLSSVSPLQANARAVGADESMQTAQDVTFTNGIHPALALLIGDITDEDGESQGRPLLESEQRQQIHAAVRQYYGGVSKTGEPLLLDALIRDVKQISMKPAEMDFVNSGKVTKDRITQGHGTHPAIIGAIEQMSRAASAVAREHFADFTINPKIALISQVLTKWMRPAFAQEGERLYVYIDEYRPNDPEERRRDFTLLAKHAAVDRDELRANVGGLDKLPNDAGRTIPIAATQVFVDVRSPLAGAVAGDGEDEPEAALAGLHLKTPGEYRLAVKAAALHGIDRLETLLALDVAKMLERVRDQIVARLGQIIKESGNSATLKRATQGGIVDVVYDFQFWNAELRRVARPHVHSAMVHGALVGSTFAAARKAAPTVDELMVPLSPSVQSGIAAEVDTIMSRPYWDEMSGTTRAKLAGAINDSMAAGESMYQLQVRIGDGNPDGVLGTASNTKRGYLIARSETCGAWNSGHFVQHEEMVADGEAMQLEWVATFDQYTRPSHADLHGKKVPKDFPNGLFMVGDSPAPHPGHHSLPAKEKCNCRCTVLSVPAEMDAELELPPAEPISFETRGDALQLDGYTQVSVEKAIVQSRSILGDKAPVVRQVIVDPSLENRGLLATKSTDAIYLNPRLSDPQARRAIQDEWKGLVIGDSTPEAVVSHEYGHIVDRAANNAHPERYHKSITGYVNEEITVTTRAGSVTGKRFELDTFGGRSFYGVEHSSEWIAEACSDVFLHGDAAVDSARILVSKLKDLL